MRGTFLDNDRKVRESKRSGSGYDEIFKPRWPLYTKLQFLRKTISSAQSVSNLSSYMPVAQCSSSQSQPQNAQNWQESNDNIQILNISSPEMPCDTEDGFYLNATSPQVSS